MRVTLGSGFQTLFDHTFNHSEIVPLADGTTINVTVDQLSLQHIGFQVSTLFHFVKPLACMFIHFIHFICVCCSNSVYYILACLCSVYLLSMYSIGVKKSFIPFRFSSRFSYILLAVPLRPFVA